MVCSHAAWVVVRAARMGKGGTATISMRPLDLAGAPILARPDGTQVTAKPTGQMVPCRLVRSRRAVRV